MIDLGSNVVANLLAAIVLAVLGWLLFVPFRLPFVYRRRKELLAFFGLRKEDTKLKIYLSSVLVLPGGSIDFRGDARTFSGPAIPAAELSAIEPIVALFGDPLLDSLPKNVRDWLGEKAHWSFRRNNLTFIGSPIQREKVASGNLLTVGSQYYNSAADVYTERCNPILRMIEQEGEMVIRVEYGARKGEVFKAREGQPDDVAIVEKVYDRATKSTVIFAAGLGVYGTIGAVYYVVENWPHLQQAFGDKPFAVCLRFQDVLTDPQAHRKPIELSRFVP